MGPLPNFYGIFIMLMVTKGRYKLGEQMKKRICRKCKYKNKIISEQKLKIEYLKEIIKNVKAKAKYIQNIAECIESIDES